MSETNLADWPAVREVAREIRLSQTYVNRLIRNGRLKAVQTHLGLLVNPDSIAALQAERAAHPVTGGRPS